MTEGEAQKLVALAKDPGYVTAPYAHLPLQSADRLTFEGGHRVTEEDAVAFLRWRAADRKGNLDEDELESAVELLKTKRVIIAQAEQIRVLD